VNAVTGFNYTKDEIMKAAERVWNLERLFNLKAGIKPEDDKLPDRFLKVPIPKGPKKGNVVPLSKLLQYYYRARGWDTRGYPTEEKIKELGLDFCKI
ncbi:MAG: aldehyde ferredoxin oxidoreductase C-terminal domain-containing protein, partial [Thermoplasmata archaeon]